MNCRPGHHHHHHGHRHHKRQENLAWFGVVIVLVILVFCGLAIWSDSSSHHAAPELPTAPIVVNPPVVETPNDPSVEDLPPAVHRDHRGRHHWSHHRRHHVGSDVRVQFCLPTTISGYVGDSVTEIPNPDCN